MPSVYEIVTERIIKQLESGVAPWRKPWTCQTPANLITQKEYRGLNVFTLASQGFPSRFWLTFNQATKLAGRIRKGEKSSSVIFWNVGEEHETTTPHGRKQTSWPFLLRYYNVFNFSQTEGIDIPASLLQETRTNDPIETCEQIVANMPNAPAFEQSHKAWYSPSNDTVGMPARGLFHSSEEYYATAFHELAHSTGHAKRLHRESFDNPASFGSESYSKEELIAEMTAAMLCGVAKIEQKILENSAAYLKTWIARLKSDSRLIISAASQAQRAADFIQGRVAVPQAAELCQTVERMSKKLSDMGVLTFGTGDGTVKFEPGDYVKFELRNDETGEAEWMWLRIDYCDEPNRIIFGWLDSQPVVFTTNIKLGQHLAVSYDNIREHKKPTEF